MLILRHFVERDERLNDLRNFNCGMKVTCSPDYVCKVKERLVGHTGWLLVDDVDRGSSTSLKQCLFAHGFDIVCCVDMDQYVDDGSYERLKDKVVRENALLGIGARNCKIVLARHTKNDRLRQINELFFALVFGKLPCKVVLEHYSTLGDVTPGYYCLNHKHPKYSELLKAVEELDLDMSGFVLDSYLVLKAKELGKVVNCPVSALENKFYGDMIEESEREFIVARMIKDYIELLKTEFAKTVIDGFRNAEFRKELCKYFPGAEVDELYSLFSHLIDY